MAEAAAPPMQPATFSDCCTSLMNYLSPIYRKLKACRLNLSHATSECFGFSNRVHVDWTGCDFFGDDQGWPLDLLGAAAFQTSAISAHRERAFFFPVFSKCLWRDTDPDNCHAVASAIAASMSKLFPRHPTLSHLGECFISSVIEFHFLISAAECLAAKKSDPLAQCLYKDNKFTNSTRQ